MMNLIENNNGLVYQIIRKHGKYALIYCEYYDEYIVAYDIQKQSNKKVRWQQGRYFLNDKTAAENYFNEKTA